MRSSLFLLIVFLACSPKGQPEVGLPYYNSPDFTPLWFEADDPQIVEMHTVPPFTFVNQDGDTISEQTFANKIYVANFFFTICPSVCPKMTQNLNRIQEAFKDDSEVLLLSHTVMPWVDSVAVLKTYAEEKEIISGKWHLVTGAKEKLYAMGRHGYFVDEGFGKSVTRETDFLHTENILLIDANRHIRGVYNGTLPLEMSRIIEDIERLKN